MIAARSDVVGLTAKDHGISRTGSYGIARFPLSRNEQSTCLLFERPSCERDENDFNRGVFCVQRKNGRAVENAVSTGAREIARDLEMLYYSTGRVCSKSNVQKCGSAMELGSA